MSHQSSADKKLRQHELITEQKKVSAALENKDAKEEIHHCTSPKNIGRKRRRGDITSSIRTVVIVILGEFPDKLRCVVGTKKSYRYLGLEKA